MVGPPVATVVDLLEFRVVPLDGDDISILAAVVLSIRDGFVLGLKLGGREG